MATGTAVQVVVANEDHTFTLDESALSKILFDPRVKDRKVMVLSIAGAFRKGKSFLLNFFLRYFHSQGSENWIGEPDAPLKGFDWRSGTERNTTGILMWSEPFKVTLANGEEACVLLMDTQGTFDNQSTVKDCATVFALSTLLSSVQVYNLMLNIQENDLQHLQYFTEYARLTLEEMKFKPFQDLRFLVRDWQNPTEHAYGWEGGQEYLSKCVEAKKDQHEDLKNIRDQINSLFTRIECFLMPHPGLKVVRDPNYDGRFSRLDEDFKPRVQEFVTSVLSPENLVVKEINGNQITGKALYEFFKIYMKIFQSNELPEPMSVYQATAEANNSAAISKANDLYTESMKKVCGGEEQFLHPDNLPLEHDRYQKEAVELFQSIQKMGGEKMIGEFQEKLLKEVKESYEKYKRINAANIAAVVKKSVDRYSEHMGKFCAKGKDGVDSKTLEEKHNRYREAIIRSLRQVVGEDEIDLFKEKFQEQTRAMYSEFKSTNSSNLFKKNVRDGVAIAGTIAGTIAAAGLIIIASGKR